MFHYKMDNEVTKKLLAKKIISHVFISLVPFPSFLSTDLEEDRIQKVFDVFKELIRMDCNSNSEEKYLDDDWSNDLHAQFINNNHLKHH